MVARGTLKTIGTLAVVILFLVLVITNLGNQKERLKEETVGRLPNEGGQFVAPNRLDLGQRSIGYRPPRPASDLQKTEEQNSRKSQGDQKSLTPPSNSTPDITTKPSDLAKLLSPVLPQSPRGIEILALPEVRMEELTLDTTGAKDFSSYMDGFLALAQNPTFPYEKYDKIAKDEGGLTFTPEALVEKAIEENDFSKFSNSFALTREFLDYKIKAVGGIKVSGEAVKLSQEMIGFDKLTINLMEEAQGVAQGETTRADFESYYQKYNATANYYYGLMAKKYGGLVFEDRRSGFLKKMAEAFGLPKMAQAFVPLPFGGMIGVATPCICNLGLMITVGSPVPGTFFISAFTSRIFAFFKPTPGSWILGDYAATPIPCMQPAFPVCVPSGAAQGVVVIAGTSL